MVPPPPRLASKCQFAAVKFLTNTRAVESQHHNIVCLVCFYKNEGVTKKKNNLSIESHLNLFIQKVVEKCRLMTLIIDEVSIIWLLQRIFLNEEKYPTRLHNPTLLPNTT